MEKDVTVVDYRGLDVRLGTLLLDDAGRVYQVCDLALASVGCVHMVEYRLRRGLWMKGKEPGIGRAYLMFSVRWDEVTDYVARHGPKRLDRLYQEMFDLYVADGVKKNLSERKFKREGSDVS